MIVELEEKAFGSLGWPDIDEISDFWIHDKKILEFKIRNSESLLLGPVRHREVQLLQAAGLSATGRPSSRSKAAAFSGLLFHKIRSNPWEASRLAMARPRCLRPMHPVFVNDDEEAGILNGCGLSA